MTGARRRAPHILAISALLFTGASLLLQAMSGQPDVAETLLGLGVLGIGYAVTTRVPQNNLGWLFLWLAVLGSFAGATDSLLDVAMDRGWDGVATVAVFSGGWMWVGQIGAVATFCLLLFPDGRLPSPRWRPVAWLAGAGIAVASAVTIAYTAIQLDDLISNPDGDFGGILWLDVLMAGAAIAVLLAAVASAASLVQRWRRAGGVARQQLKWFAFGGLVQLIGIAAGFGEADGAVAAIKTFVAEVTILALPAAAALGILKYRLYDIDRLISRTVAYAVVSGLLLAVYLGTVTALTEVLAGSGDRSPLAVAAATLATAAAFRPARKRVQTVVDRRFNRARYDAERAAAEYRSRLRDELDLQTIGNDLLATVVNAVQPSAAVIWWRSEP